MSTGRLARCILQSFYTFYSLIMNSYGPNSVKRLLINWALRAKYRLVTLQRISAMFICSNEKKNTERFADSFGK